jgi:hypothetical protein
MEVRDKKVNDKKEEESKGNLQKKLPLIAVAEDVYVCLGNNVM